MQEIDELVERSGALEEDLLAFAQRPQFARALTEEIRRRFGAPVMAEEAELENFLDWFVQQYRRPDGRTIVDCFLEARSDLPDHEREFVRGWRDVVEGMFEVTGRDGPALVAVNMIDDLTYRIHANVGPSIFDAFPDGSFVLTRLVPVGVDWLISGVSAAYGADSREDLLRIAARQAIEYPNWSSATRTASPAAGRSSATTGRRSWSTSARTPWCSMSPTSGNGCRSSRRPVPTRATPGSPASSIPSTRTSEPSG